MLLGFSTPIYHVSGSRFHLCSRDKRVATYKKNPFYPKNLMFHIHVCCSTIVSFSRYMRARLFGQVLEIGYWTPNLIISHFQLRYASRTPLLQARSVCNLSNLSVNLNLRLHLRVIEHYIIERSQRSSTLRLSKLSSRAAWANFSGLFNVAACSYRALRHFRPGAEMGSHYIDIIRN